MSQAPNLARPLTLGKLTLKNRVVLASMTRNRNPYAVPGPDVVDYYTQRANAGLIITEGVLIVPIGSEWPSAPGIWSNKQVDAWKVVTKAVQEQDSKIFAQIWHIGRVAHPLHQAGQPALSPSGIGAKGGKFRLLVGEPGYVSDPLPIEDPSVIVEQYRAAAVNAFKANFDGIELHAANGYLPHQFLEAHSNKRTDAWGGSAEKRARFILDIIKAFVEVAGDSKKVGIKLSPAGGYNDMGDPEDVLTEEYSYLITELNKLKIGYIQLSRSNPDFDTEKRGTNIDVIAKFRKLITNSLVIGNAGYSGEEAEKQVADGTVDAVAFGRPYIGNPDLATRLFNGQALNWNVDWATLYNPPEGQPLGTGYSTYKTFGQE